MAKTAEPCCAVCDDRGVVIGKDTIANAFATGKTRLTVHIILLNGRGELLVQQRAKNMLIHPLYWDTAAAGHVDFGESPAHAARRELREETGLDVADLKHLGEKFMVTRWKDKEFKDYQHVFAARVEGEAERLHEKMLQKSEVAAAKWVTRVEFNELEPISPGAFYAIELLEKAEI